MASHFNAMTGSGADLTGLTDADATKLRASCLYQTWDSIYFGTKANQTLRQGAIKLNAFMPDNATENSRKPVYPFVRVLPTFAIKAFSPVISRETADFPIPQRRRSNRPGNSQAKGSASLRAYPRSSHSEECPAFIVRRAYRRSKRSSPADAS